MISSANSVSLKSKDEIIVGNILRENIELVKNLRDGNWMRSKNWDAIDPNTTVTDVATSTKLEVGNYIIENNYSSAAQPIRIEKLPYNTIDEATIRAELAKISGTKLRLCIDEKGRYTHDCNTSTNKKTPFFSFIEVSRKNTLATGESPIELTGALSIGAYVYASDAGIRLYDMHTLITDWKK